MISVVFQELQIGRVGIFFIDYLFDGCQLGGIDNYIGDFGIIVKILERLKGIIYFFIIKLYRFIIKLILFVWGWN